jgi:cysteine desulfurase
MKTYYLDHAATTPLDHDVLESMMPYLTDQFGNPSSMHQMGVSVKRAINEVRECLAHAFDTHTQGVIFTSGGTEATNLAIRGYAKKNPDKKVIITSPIEHHATIHTLDALKKEGYIIRECKVDHEGLIDIGQLKSSIDSHTLLVTLIAANNEIGTMQQIALIGQLCHAQGVLFHVDGVQWVGHERLSMIHDHVDMLSISAHKFYGPKGIGALILRPGLEISPILYGGMQEKGMRSGTENVAGIIGLGKAYENVISEMVFRKEHLKRLTNHLIASLDRYIPSCVINGPKDPSKRLPGLVSVSFPSIASHEFAYACDQKGVFVSTGSACLSNQIHESHVLKAIGVIPSYGTLRISVGKDTTFDDIVEVVMIIKTIYDELKEDNK